jgi:hypothetical protein
MSNFKCDYYPLTDASGGVTVYRISWPKAEAVFVEHDGLPFVDDSAFTLYPGLKGYVKNMLSFETLLNSADRNLPIVPSPPPPQKFDARVAFLIGRDSIIQMIIDQLIDADAADIVERVKFGDESEYTCGPKSRQ